METSKVLEAVINEMKSREQVGIKKYGVTLDRNDLSVKDLLQHLLEEQMDSVMYTKAALMKLEEKSVGAKEESDWKNVLQKLPSTSSILCRVKVIDPTYQTNLKNNERFGWYAVFSKTWYVHKNRFSNNFLPETATLKVTHWKEV